MQQYVIFLDIQSLKKYFLQAYVGPLKPSFDWEFLSTPGFLKLSHDHCIVGIIIKENIRTPL